MFLSIPTVIDDVKMETLVSNSQIIYAEPWMLADQSADTGSIRIHRVGTDRVIRAMQTLEWLSYKPGYVLISTAWRIVPAYAGGPAKSERMECPPTVFNISNIIQLRPYSLRSKADHYVLYVPSGVVGRTKDFHISNEDANFLKTLMTVQ